MGNTTWAELQKREGSYCFLVCVSTVILGREQERTYIFSLSPLQVEMGHHLRFICLVCLGLTVTWTHPINVTVGHSILLPCQVNFSTHPIDLKKFFVYWQDNNEKVLFYLNEGKVLSEHQNHLYKNRIKASEKLAFGNISLEMEGLTIQDNSKTVCAYYREQDQELERCVCNSTIFVAVPFQKPKLVNLTAAMLANCTTQGGFPQPELTWIHTFQNTSNNRILERSEAGNTSTVEQNGTYYVESVVSVTGSRSVTCSVTNPTSKQTLNVSIPTDFNEVNGTSETWIIVAVIGPVFIVGVIICACIFRKRITNRPTCHDGAAGVRNLMEMVPLQR
ncbi:ICOS ligand-like [Osmerus mordax]|uniref:ICOS ligand-like n=1 Tax=Osmerus mordax TaxID=8014 RepID=UPI00350F5AD0